MFSHLTNMVNRTLEPRFPEQRIFLRSQDTTRFIRLSPLKQVFGWAFFAIFIGWSIISTAIIMMDSIGSGQLREQAQREKVLYEQRLQSLASERDTRAREASAAHERFNLALGEISKMQSELLNSEERRKELDTGIGVIQSTLRRTMNERDHVQDSLEEMLAAAKDERQNPNSGAASKASDATLDFLTAELARTATERDLITANAVEAEQFAQKMLHETRLRDERNEQIFRQLEDAVTVSLAPMDKMFSKSGMSVEHILNQVRKGYSGQGGPLTPMVLSALGAGVDRDAERANSILNQLDRMNLYRIAAQKMPFTMPVKSGFRFTSGFGRRWGRMHNGTDFAAPVGTSVYAPADGVVISAGWGSGYGRLIKIQHQFGIETRYAHLSRMDVKKGQRVSRGDKIGAIGNSGRSTGPHLHYEIRVGGKPVNPMIYIKAAKDVL